MSRLLFLNFSGNCNLSFEFIISCTTSPTGRVVLVAIFSDGFTRVGGGYWKTKDDSSHLSQGCAGGHSVAAFSSS